jgi:hypothetical protein
MTYLVQLSGKASSHWADALQGISGPLGFSPALRVLGSDPEQGVEYLIGI